MVINTRVLNVTFDIIIEVYLDLSWCFVEDCSHICYYFLGYEWFKNFSLLLGCNFLSESPYLVLLVPPRETVLFR